MINEAVAAGKPVIVGEAAGASADLVAEGENGFIVEPCAGSFAREMERLIMSKELRKRYGEASGRRREKISPNTYRRAFEMLLRVLHLVMTTALPGKPGILGLDVIAGSETVGWYRAREMTGAAS